MTLRLAAALLLALTGCTTVPPLGPPAGSVPDLRGTWSGTWGDQPLTLRILEQPGTSEGGVVLGPWPIFGSPLPGVAGVLTWGSGREATSMNVEGRVGETGAGLTVVLEPPGHELVLTLRDPGRLTGSGWSRHRFHPQGPIVLTRAPS